MSASSLPTFDPFRGGTLEVEAAQKIHSYTRVAQHSFFRHLTL